MKNLTKNQWIGDAVGEVTVGFFFGASNFIIPLFTPEQSGDSAINESNTMSQNQDANSSQEGDNSGSLVITDILVGSGKEATAGSNITVNYVGTFADGTKFDSSYDRGEPFPFTLGAGGVIQGWDLGLIGMKVGGKRHLVIPPELGYGPNDYGPIPGNSTLIFDVELLAVE